MRIAILTPQYYPIVSGAELFAQEVAERLVEGGNEVDVVTGQWNSNLKTFEEINGVNIYRARIWHVRYFTAATLALFTLLKVFRLDKTRRYHVIHSVGMSPIDYIGALFSRFRNKPHIMSIQGGPILRDLEGNIIYRSILGRLIKWKLRNADIVHVISRCLVTRAEEFGARDIVLVPNGVDNTFFTPLNREGLRQKYGFSPDEKIIMSIARLEPVKGLGYLIKALPLVREEFPETCLIIIGRGPQQRELEGLISLLRLNDEVDLLGYVPHEYIPEYLNLADLFVLPSIKEPLGIVEIEALACGIPVIATNVDGIPDVIEDGKNGLLVSPGDEKELAGAIKRLLKDEGLRNQFIVEGLETVRQNFLWDDIADKIYQQYLKCAQMPSR